MTIGVTRGRACAAIALGFALLIPSPAAAQEGWTGVVTDVSLPGRDMRYDLSLPGVQLAVDPAGNATAVWILDGRLRASRYTAATRTWSAQVDLGGDPVPSGASSFPGPGSTPIVLADSLSNAFVVWIHNCYALQVVRYAANTQTWSAATLVATDVCDFRAVVDSQGRATVIWAVNTGLADLDVVRAARYAPATDSWSVTTIAPPGRGPAHPPVADAEGNVTAVWATKTKTIEAARYTAATGTWSLTTVASSADTVSAGPAAVDAAGNVIAAWYVDGGSASPYGRIQAARYVASTGAWSPPVDLSDLDASSPKLAANPAGDAVVVWSRHSEVQAARYSAAANAWSTPGSLSPAGSHAFVSAAMDGSGNAFVTWALSEGHFYTLQAVRFAAQDHAWSSPVSFDTRHGSFPAPGGEHELAVDQQGNAMVAWPGGRGLRMWRWPVGGTQWSAPADVAASFYRWQIGVDAAGNAIAVWNHSYNWSEYNPNVIQSSQWRATPTAPAITGVSVGDGSLDVAFTPPDTPEPLYAPANYEYSLDDGATWTARSPASIDSPLLIASLTPGVVYPVRLRAVNVAGPGLPSAVAASTPGPVPAPPIDLQVVAVAGSTVTLQWSMPPYSVPAADYLLEAGLQPGAAEARVRTGSPQPAFTLDAPVDGFYVRVYALSGAQRSGPSSEIRVYMRTPGPPSDLAATVIDNRVTLTWAAPRNSVAPASYLVEGGLQPGQVLASMPTGSSATQVTFTVPYGSYHVRVHAVANGLESLPSNEVAVTATLVPPAAPHHLLGLVNGSALALSWTNAVTGGPPASLILSVTGSLSTTVAVPVGESFTFAGVPPGTYTFTLAAVNGAGTSATANAVTLAFPGACSGAPDPPTGVFATTIGRSLTLEWNPPLTGAAVTQYLVQVTGSYTGAFPTTTRFVTGVVGPGTYALSVAAVNPCGTGPPVSAGTVIVP